MSRSKLWRNLQTNQKFMRRLKNSGLIKDFGKPWINLYGFKSCTKPCSCFICKGERYKRHSKHKQHYQEECDNGDN